MNGMTCREFDEVVHAFVRMELLDAALREEILDHAAGCANCTERMAEAGALAEATDTFGKSLREQQAPLHVETAVMAAFRDHHRHAAWRLWFEWSAVAAAILLVVFLWTNSGSSRGQSPAPRKDVSSQTTQPLDVHVPASQQQDLTQDAYVEVADASAMEKLYTTSNFVPVTSTEGISPEDPGMIMRVQLTRASLAELGYPLAETPDDDLIQADVLVGEDGWPRAVRLVQ